MGVLLDASRSACERFVGRSSDIFSEGLENKKKKLKKKKFKLEQIIFCFNNEELDKARGKMMFRE